MGKPTILTTIAAGCGAVAGVAGAAQADVPARAFLGAEKVAIQCRVAGPMEAADGDALCAALVEQARGMTTAPVRAVSGDEGVSEADLVLDIAITADTARPDSVALRASARRVGLARAKTPRTMPLDLPLRWVDGRPVPAAPARALALFLGAPLARPDNPLDWNREGKGGS